MKGQTRTENTIRNISIAWMGQGIHILCQFLLRTVIIKKLSMNYIGLSGLFGNILSVLSLAELGIGEAIIFSLYRPIAERRVAQMKSIMHFYRKVYRAIGLIVLLAGCALTPFLNYFMKETPDIPQLETLYVLFVCNTAMSYFFSYKAAFITANQKNYMVQLNMSIFEVLSAAVQTGVLLVFKNYPLSLFVSVVILLGQNLSISFLADKTYPFLREKDPEKLDRAVFGGILKNTMALVLHKVGSVVVYATDNLLISKFIGLQTAGVYSNYCLLTNSVVAVIDKAFSAMVASVGNLGVAEKTEKQEQTLYRMFFLDFWMNAVAGCCFLGLLNPFIKMWAGEDYLFGEQVVALMVIKIFLSGMRRAAQTFKNALGLYWNNKYMPLAEAAINLISSILFVTLFGISGILLGTILSTLTTCLWVEPYVLYKYGFQKSMKTYMGKYLRYTAEFILLLGLTCFISRMGAWSGIGLFIVKAVTIFGASNLILVGLHWKNNEFIYFRHQLCQIWKKAIRRK